MRGLLLVFFVMLVSIPAVSADILTTFDINSQTGECRFTLVHPEGYAYPAGWTDVDTYIEQRTREGTFDPISLENFSHPGFGLRGYGRGEEEKEEICARLGLHYVPEEVKPESQFQQEQQVPTRRLHVPFTAVFILALLLPLLVIIFTKNRLVRWTYITDILMKVILLPASMLFLVTLLSDEPTTLNTVLMPVVSALAVLIPLIEVGGVVVAFIKKERWQILLAAVCTLAVTVFYFFS